MNLIFAIVAFGICSSCAISGRNAEISTIENNTPTIDPTSVEASKGTPDKLYNLRNSLGLLRSTEKSVQVGGVKFYNKDGSLWYEFGFADVGEENRRDVNENFQPFRYNSDDGYVVLNVVGGNETFFEVIVNEESRDLKYVRKNDQSFELLSWNQYILACFAVGFDAGSNTLLSQPETGDKIQVIQESLVYHPSEIRGNWLKVVWFENDDRNKTQYTGWIRWRDGDNLAIYLFERA